MRSVPVKEPNISVIPLQDRQASLALVDGTGPAHSKAVSRDLCRGVRIYEPGSRACHGIGGRCAHGANGARRTADGARPPPRGRPASRNGHHGRPGHDRASRAGNGPSLLFLRVFSRNCLVRRERTGRAPRTACKAPSASSANRLPCGAGADRTASPSPRLIDCNTINSTGAADPTWARPRSKC